MKPVAVQAAAASCRETAVQFDCMGERLVGIVSEPCADAKALGVLIVVGGPQYRAGSHRQFTLLARALADAGHAALRFDCRGMGDSSGEAPGYDAIDLDVEAAIQALRTANPAVQRVVLWGLCDGASAALLYAYRRRDPCIAGFVLANPWLHTAQAEAHALVHSYYRQRLLDAAFWRKLLRGGINPWSRLREMFGHWRRARAPGTATAVTAVTAASATSATSATSANADTLLNALAQLRLPILLLLCRRDATAQGFLSQLALTGSRFLEQKHVERVDFDLADHTFSRAEWRRDVEDATIAWLNRL